MHGKTKSPKFVVTVLRDNAPLVVCEITRDGEQSEGVECIYPDVESLQVAREAVATAAGGMGYLLWKETGVLPAPLDMTHDADPEDYPF